MKIPGVTYMLERLIDTFMIKIFRCTCIVKIITDNLRINRHLETFVMKRPD